MSTSSRLARALLVVMLLSPGWACTTDTESSTTENGDGSTVSEDDTSASSPDAFPEPRGIRGDGQSSEPDSSEAAHIDGSVSDSSPDAGLVPGPCTEPESGMILTEDTTLCGGTWTMEPVGPETSAIRVAGDNITVECRGTALEHEGGFAKRRKPNSAFLVDNWSNVEIHGCSARGFRYGLIAKKTENLKVVDVDFSRNFDDPDKRRVFNPVNGGGIRLEGARGGVVRDSTLQHNWNGLALIDSRKVEVRNNDTAPSSNSGISLIRSHDNVVENNDFSRSFRGDDVSFPDKWYGAHLKDSAGVIIDDRSSNNRVVGNRIVRSGDGIVLRDVSGFCATDNQIENNELSEIAHHALESTCDANAFVGNEVTDSRFGVWLEGASETVVRDNRIQNSRVDGIAVQIADNRHVTLEGNTIAGSGRAGLLVSGRTYRARHGLDRWGDKLSHTSHLLVQHNTFRNNDARDVFTSSTRAVLLASNCAGGDELDLEVGREATFVDTTGACRDGKQSEAPRAELTVPDATRVGTSASLDASNSQIPGSSDGSTTFRWLVQSAGSTFDEMPSAVAAGPQGKRIEPTFDEPGLFDVSVTVDDGERGAMAWDQIAVLPEGTVRGQAAGDWGYGCAKGDDKPVDGEGDCTTTISETDGLDDKAVHVETNASYDFKIYTPGDGGLDLDVSDRNRLGFFLKATNPNGRGWQGGNFPLVKLEGDGGAVAYRPESQRMPIHSEQWTFVSIPLAGGDGWARNDEGGSLTDVDRIALYADTWGFDPVEIWIDGVVFY